MNSPDTGMPEPKDIKHVIPQPGIERRQPVTAASLEKKDAELKYPHVGRQLKDSKGSEEWRAYLDASRLRAAWSPPEGSVYEKYQKSKTMDSIDDLKDSIQPRYSDGDRVSVEGLKEMISEGLFDEHTAIVLDSGGAHSVPMAAELVARLGYQPVVMLDSPSC